MKNNATELRSNGGASWGFCNCMNITTKNYKGKFQRVETYADGICTKCDYYAKSDNEMEQRVNSFGRDTSDLLRLVGGTTSGVSYYHRKMVKRKRVVKISQRKTYTDDFKKDFVDRGVESGLGVRKFCIQEGISEGTGHAWWIDYDGQNRHEQRELNTVKKLLSEGLNNTEISKRVSKSRRTVSNMVKRIRKECGGNK